MRFFYLLLALSLQCAAEKTLPSRETREDKSDEKRNVEDRNTGKEKRAPLLAGPTPSPGIEYADVTQELGEKSPTHTIYATPEPQLSKISDVLSGRQTPFPAVIASHLLSPTSVYQARISPPTFAVSQPVPSRLAYTEHKIYQPQPGIQYFNVQPNIQPLQQQVQANQQQLQQIPHQHQQIQQQIQPFQQQLQLNVQQLQPIHHQFQPNPQQIQSPPQQIQPTQKNIQPVQQFPFRQQSINRPIFLARFQNYQPLADPYYQQGQPLLYTQHQQIPQIQHQPLYNGQSAQPFYQQFPQIAYTQNQVQNTDPYTQIPRVFNQNQHQQPFNQQQPIFHQQPFPQQVYQQPPVQVYQQPAPSITYAKQQIATADTSAQQAQISQRDLKQRKDAEESNGKQQNKNSEPAYSYASFSQSQPQSYQSSSQEQSQSQPSPNAMRPTQKTENQQSGPANQYPQIVHLYQQQGQPQVYQQRQEVLLPNKGFVPQPVGVASNGPTLQYFGKFAQSIFGSYQPQ